MTSRGLPADLRVSIALCTFNGDRFLAEQLESFRRQSHLPDELIVCDDGSTDATAEIVRVFALDAPFPVHWSLNERTLGPAKNFERAIGLCTGDLIVLSDQDDVWREDKIAAIVARFRKEPALGAVFSDADVVDARLQPLGYRVWRTVGFDRAQQARMRGPAGALKVLLSHNVVTGATLAFRAKFTPAILPIGGGWMHDGWIALQIAGLSEIGFVAEPLVLYRQHGSNQIGGVRQSLSQRIEAAGRDDAIDRYRSTVDLYRSAVERLRHNADAARWQGLEPLLTQKLLHAENRYRLRMTRRGHILAALKELTTLRYHRYSAGWRSFLKDIF